MKSHEPSAILYALLAAVFYALNAPGSKLLLNSVEPTTMAGLLYVGAGLGVGALWLARRATGRLPRQANDLLVPADAPYVMGMVVLDIAAPILLMLSLTRANASTVSLLNNFEIVATTVIALVLFGEKVSPRLWAGIALITVASIVLSLEDVDSLRPSLGALLALAATCCWGLENNCTRRIASRNTYQIVCIKGLCSGAGSLVVARVMGEGLPAPAPTLAALVLGFVAYGLSIFCYIRAQGSLGAAKTSAYYAVAPFIGAALGLALLHEALSPAYFVALAIMVVGTVVVTADTLGAAR